MSTNDLPPMISDDLLFRDAVQGLHRGDFSRLEPLFDEHRSLDHHHCQTVDWLEKGRFDDEPRALAEAFTCACFLGRTKVVDFLLTRGVDPTVGNGTGLNGFHWAANRGQLDTVRTLIERKVPLETKSMYGGTVLGTAVWSAINEPRAAHAHIIEMLIVAGANLDDVGYPSGEEQIDDVFRRHGAR